MSRQADAQNPRYMPFTPYSLKIVFISFTYSSLPSLHNYALHLSKSAGTKTAKEAMPATAPAINEDFALDIYGLSEWR